MARIAVHREPPGKPTGFSDRGLRESTGIVRWDSVVVLMNPLAGQTVMPTCFSDG